MLVQKVTAKFPTNPSARALINCKACGRPFASVKRSQYCSSDCRRAPAPAVYRFICPDGRSYVGSRRDIRRRHVYGVLDHNERLAAILDQYPSETWAYEILQILPPGCSDEIRYAAEQRHIDRLQSWHPAHGFNASPADYSIDSPAKEFARQRMAALLIQIRTNLKARHVKTEGLPLAKVKPQRSRKPRTRRRLRKRQEQNDSERRT